MVLKTEPKSMAPLQFLSILGCLASIAILADAVQAQPATSQVTIQLDVRDQTIQATPVLATDRRVMMLGRDGQMWDFSPSEAANFTRLTTSFRPLMPNEMRGALMAEFGREFEVTGTGHYLVVHPAGTKDRWAEQFEQLYRSFQGYFTSRGIDPQKATFPLVAIVFPDFPSYQTYAARSGMRVSPAVVGYYSSATNRVALYDVTGGNPQDPLWQENMATIIHEATHQTAFNTGIHSRYAPQPKWLVEGLATMFEAPGVWNSRNHPRLRDRVNQQRLAEFLEYAASSRPANSLAEFVSNDQVYFHRPGTAYGEGWALAFFLIETRPRELASFIKRVAARPAGEPYPAQARLDDFQQAFGSDLTMLESHFLRYMQQLPDRM